MTYDEKLLSYRMMLTLRLELNCEGKNTRKKKYRCTIRIDGKCERRNQTRVYLYGYIYITLIVYGFGV